MTTFSQLVDDMTTEHVRPDLRTSIAAYANQTIREVHAGRNNSAPILFGSNRYEAEWTVVGNPSLWTIPHVSRFQRLEAVYLVEAGVYAQERSPDRVYKDYSPENRYYWYRTGAQIAIGDRSSQSLVGTTVRFSYFLFPKQLKYYAANARPAVFDVETEGFTYAAGYEVSDESRAQAEELSTNWILLRWGEAVIKQGVRAKVFARLGEERARIAYSSFESMREQLHAAEQWQQNTV